MLIVVVFMGALLVYSIFFYLPQDYKVQQKQDTLEECLDLYKHDIYLLGCKNIVMEYLKKYE